MGAPTSAISNTGRIFTIYDQMKTNIDETLTELTTQQTNIIFTTEKEQRNSINFQILHHTIKKRN
jgi:hypothetical protein